MKDKLILELLHKDLDERNRKGLLEYGKELTAYDGRDTLWDALEEALDLAMYLRKAIEERDSRLVWRIKKRVKAVWRALLGKADK